MKIEFDNVDFAMAEDIIYAAEMSAQGLRVLPESAWIRRRSPDAIIVGLFIWDEKDQDYRNAKPTDVMRLMRAEVQEQT